MDRDRHAAWSVSRRQSRRPFRVDQWLVCAGIGSSPILGVADWLGHTRTQPGLEAGPHVVSWIRESNGMADAASQISAAGHGPSLKVTTVLVATRCGRPTRCAVEKSTNRKHSRQAASFSCA